MIPVLIGVTILTFVIMRSAGDPTYAYSQQPDKMTDQQYRLIRQKYHLDDPLHIQYLYWLDGLLHGDWGYTTADANRPVLDVIAKRFPATFELALIATFFYVLIGITLGTISAVRANSAVDQATRVISLIAVSIPVFWLAVVFQMVFFYNFHLFPLNERYSSLVFNEIYFSQLDIRTNFLLVDGVLNWKWDLFVDALWHLVLPAVALAFVSTALIIRIMRASMLEVLSAEYVQTARSKGVPEKIVIKKHARRNALIPTVTVVGLSFGGLLGGAVLTETIFTWNGLGRWSASAALRLDTAGIMGFTLLTAVIYVLANLIVDMTYAYLDPRVRLG